MIPSKSLRKSAVPAYEAQPNHTWNAADATYTTDEFGFRTHLSDRQWSRSDSKRIFVLGGSSVFGYGLNDDQTWVHLLEEKLRQDLKDRDLNVINAETLGHNSLQSLLSFYLRVLPLKPQVLLYYEGINDVDENVQRIDSTFVEEDVLFSETMTSVLSKRYAHKSFYFRTLLAHVVNTRLWREIFCEPCGAAGGDGWGRSSDQWGKWNGRTSYPGGPDCVSSYPVSAGDISPRSGRRSPARNGAGAGFERTPRSRADGSPGCPRCPRG